MKYLRLYENFGDIDKICQDHNIHNYIINNDGTVDVDGYVILSRMNLSTLPLNFGKVTGNFHCHSNKLTTLNGSPKEVGGYFSCRDNKLTTLVGGPRKVEKNYYCNENNLTDVYGFPEVMGGTLHIYGNPTDEIFNLVGLEKELKFIFWLNEYDVIRDGNKIVEMRLEEAYYMTCKEELPMYKRTFKNYILI